jgi:phage replication-related protein YjqB (UPF0714/DUF867 family)
MNRLSAIERVISRLNNAIANKPYNGLEVQIEMSSEERLHCLDDNQLSEEFLECFELQSIEDIQSSEWNDADQYLEVILLPF